MLYTYWIEHLPDLESLQNVWHWASLNWVASYKECLIIYNKVPETSIVLGVSDTMCYVQKNTKLYNQCICVNILKIMKFNSIAYHCFRPSKFKYTTVTDTYGTYTSLVLQYSLSRRENLILRRCYKVWIPTPLNSCI